MEGVGGQWRGWEGSGGGRRAVEGGKEETQGLNFPLLAPFPHSLAPSFLCFFVGKFSPISPSSKHLVSPISCCLFSCFPI